MAKMKSTEIGFREMLQVSGVAVLVTLGLLPILQLWSQNQANADWDKARIADVSSRGGMNRRITLSSRSATTAELELDTLDNGTLTVDLPLHSGTTVSFYDRQGRRLVSPASSPVNNCYRLVVDGKPVGVRGESGSVICSYRGGRIVWPNY